MATKITCDRCSKDMNATPKVHVSGHISQEATAAFDLCGPCKFALVNFLKPLPVITDRCAN